MPGGRPSKFSPTLQLKICTTIADGATYAEAAEAAGIDYTTLLRWKQAGEKAKGGQYYEFCKALKKAEDQSESTLLSRIVKAGTDPKHWQANAWILERRFPHKWGKVDRMEHTGKDGSPLLIKVERITNNA